MAKTALSLLMVSILLMSLTPNGLHVLEENTHSNMANYNPVTPGIVELLISTNSTGDSNVLSVDAKQNGLWAACAIFNGTLDLNSLGGTGQGSIESKGESDILIFGGSSLLSVSWYSHLDGVGENVCWGVSLLPNNLVLTYGTYEESISIGSSTKYSEGKKDSFVGLYNVSMGAWTHVTDFGGSEDDEIYSMSQHASGFSAVGRTNSDLTNSTGLGVFTFGTTDCSNNPCGMVLDFSSELSLSKGNLVSSDNNIKFYDVSNRNAAGLGVIIGAFQGNLTFHDSSVSGIVDQGSWDIIVIQVNSTLGITGVNRIGGNGFDAGKAIESVVGGGYIIAAEVTGQFTSSRPFNASYTSTAGGRDIGVFQLYENLTIFSNQNFGGAGTDQLADLSSESSGSFAVSGQIQNQISLNSTTIGVSNAKATFVASFTTDALGINSDWGYSATGSLGSTGRGNSVHLTSSDVMLWGGRSTPSGPSGTQIGGFSILGGGSDAGYLALFDVDEDGDAIGSRSDICPNVFDPNQFNWDNDQFGDECDDDDDQDGILDNDDMCPRNATLAWLSTLLNDYDSDGCRDDGNENQGLGQDEDDDNDGRLDSYDACPKGSVGWSSLNVTYDHDSDGCKDSDEDLDDDNDGVPDEDDSCNPPDSAVNIQGVPWSDHDGDGCNDGEDPDIDDDGRYNNDDYCNYSVLGFNSLLRTQDWDGDGCNDDSDEDADQDSLIDDINDDCPPPGSSLGWSYDGWIDYDGDGCHDEDEDEDDDNDGILDDFDDCPTGEKNWASDLTTDFDQDGCKDFSSEDLDDDNDGVPDVDDNCQRSPSTAIDYDGDGCTGEHDLDWDNDGRDNLVDDCPNGTLNWSSNSNSNLDNDGDGCHDGNEDQDDDNDGMYDWDDTCPQGSINWDAANSVGDHDADGCRDSDEDTDDDNDGIEDLDEECPKSPLGDYNDHDMDGCIDANDPDDDNDGIQDDVDRDQVTGISCAFSPMIRNNLTDIDADGCFDNVDPDLDGDGIINEVDSCSSLISSVGWYSISRTDHDGDGCKDLDEDTDDDEDGLTDDQDQCPKGVTNWNYDSLKDFDKDGCRDSDEDDDDDNDYTDDIRDQFPLDCRYNLDTDGDGSPDPSSIVNCKSVGVIDLRVDTDSDDDGTSDVREITCETDPLDKGDFPSNKGADNECEPTPLAQFLNELTSSQKMIIIGLIFLALFMILLLATLKAGNVINTYSRDGDNLSGYAMKAGNDAIAGTKVDGNLAKDNAYQENSSNPPTPGTPATTEPKLEMNSDAKGGEPQPPIQPTNIGNSRHGDNLRDNAIKAGNDANTGTSVGGNLAKGNANQENLSNPPTPGTPATTEPKLEMNSDAKGGETLPTTQPTNNAVDIQSVNDITNEQTSQRNDGSKKGDVQDETKVKLKETPSSVKKSDDSTSFTSDLEW